MDSNFNNIAKQIASSCSGDPSEETGGDSHTCGGMQEIPAIQPDQDVGEPGIIKGTAITISKTEEGKLHISSNDLELTLPVAISEALEKYYQLEQT